MTNEKTIRDSAMKLWARRGYGAVGVQEICQEAGITKPTLYHYFGSKQGLLSQILEVEYGLLCPILETEGSYRGDLKTALELWSSNWMKYAREHQDFFRMTLSLSFSPPDSEEASVALPWASRVYGSLVDLFEKASGDHGNMKGRAQSYALGFLGLMQTHGLMVINRQISWTEEYARKILHYFMHGVFS